MKFKRHYRREEAEALLPQIRKWLETLDELRRSLEKYEVGVGSLNSGGWDTGGELINSWVKTLASIKQTLLEFYRRDIQIKDLGRGLLDFPAIIGGREVFLCWEKDEDRIEFWHELDAGYAGREPL